MEMLVIRFPGSGTNCKENDGFGEEIFAISNEKWESLSASIKKIKEVSTCGYEEFDYSNGGHGCIITIDFIEAFEACDILEENAHPEVVKFVAKIQSTNFLRELEYWIKNEEEELKKEENGKDDEKAKYKVEDDDIEDDDEKIDV